MCSLPRTPVPVISRTMNQESKFSPVDPLPERDSWRESRSGAWAGRGFHYQHLVSTLILVRQWAGLSPHGSLVPEGLDDCVLELADRRIWVQIKSRKEATFPDAEVSRILDAADARSSRISTDPTIRSTVVLEQPRTNRVEADVARILDDEAGRVFICQTPAEDIVRLLSTQLAITQVIAEGLASDLYTLVAGASEQNASLPYENRRRISTTEVERRIFERLEAEDPSAIDEALVSGALEPVDFTTPVHEPDFYRGVKVTSGHLAAKLVLDRPRDVNRVLDALMERRHVLVSGPSGSGKSALTWLAASAAAGRVRWFQITATATPADAQAIIRFVRARRPRKSSPLGLVFDEVASANSNLWNVLVRELRGIPALYFLGSVRQEDVHLIANQSDTDFVQVVLGEDLAETVWHELRARSHTSWTHWREPFEQSNGLMLEFVHLLTQGQRLAAVIEDQIRQREREGRNDELKIVRSAAVICAHDGEVEASALFELLDLNPDAANLALKRLIDEHLVRESRPGVLGGLHMLRSTALVKASHDETVFLADATLWDSLPAATSETLPRVVQSVLSASAGNGEPQPLRHLAGFLEESRDIDQWTAILTGLGLATLERHVALFMTVLEQHEVQRAHWLLASMFADPQLDVPTLTGAEQLKSLQDAILEFRASPKSDLRTVCLQHLPAGSSPPRSDDIVRTNRLLSSLAPICGGDSMRIALPSEVRADPLRDIRQTALLLSTAYHVDPELARTIVESLGGERDLLDQFHSQFPWTTRPTIDPSGQHGRTVRSDWYQVEQRNTPDPHETICEICETLIALSPCFGRGSLRRRRPGRTGCFRGRAPTMVQEHAEGELAVQGPRSLECRLSSDPAREIDTRQPDRLHNPDGTARSPHRERLPIVYREMDQAKTHLERRCADFRDQQYRRVSQRARVHRTRETSFHDDRAGSRRHRRHSGRAVDGRTRQPCSMPVRFWVRQSHCHVCRNLARPGERASSVRHLAHHVIASASRPRQAFRASRRRFEHPA